MKGTHTMWESVHERRLLPYRVQDMYFTISQHLTNTHSPSIHGIPPLRLQMTKVNMNMFFLLHLNPVQYM